MEQRAPAQGCSGNILRSRGLRSQSPPQTNTAKTIAKPMSNIGA